MTDRDTLEQIKKVAEMVVLLRPPRDDRATCVARVLIAALPVVEAARDILRLFAMGPLDLAAHYGPDVDFDALSTEAALKLQAAFAAFDRAIEGLKP